EGLGATDAAGSGALGAEFPPVVATAAPMSAPAAITPRVSAAMSQRNLAVPAGPVSASSSSPETAPGPRVWSAELGSSPPPDPYPPGRPIHVLTRNGATGW